MNNTPADMQHWIQEHKDLFAAFLEAPDETLIALDMANAKVAFSSTNTTEFMRKITESERDDHSYSVVGVPGLREAGVLPDRRKSWGLPALHLQAVDAPLIPQARVPVPPTVAAVLLEEEDMDMDTTANDLYLAEEQIKQLRAELALYRGYHDELRARLGCTPLETPEQKLEAIREQALQTCYLIEAAGASEALTIAVTQASAVGQALTDQRYFK